MSLNIGYFETECVYENAGCFWWRTTEYTIKKSIIPFMTKKTQIEQWDIHSFEATYEKMQEQHFGSKYDEIKWSIKPKI